MQAGAADLVLVDEGDLEAELGGAERRGIAAGARAEHDEIEVIGRADGHGSGCLEVPRDRSRWARATVVGRGIERPAGRVGHRWRWYARRRETRNRPLSQVGGSSGGPVLDSGRGRPEKAGVPDRCWSVPLDPALVLRTAILMLVAYLAGSVPVGVLVARASGGADPRTIGSGRTGGTNALRALGRKWAAVVVIGDLLKGALPVLLARVVTGGDPLVEALCGGSAVAGAIWSVFAGFRSGRGVGTGVGTMLVIQPLAVVAGNTGLHRRDPAHALRLARVAARRRRRCCR